MIVLGWTRTESPRILENVVANRVTEVRSLTKSLEWIYDPTNDNPADLSRDMPPQKSNHCKL